MNNKPIGVHGARNVSKNIGKEFRNIAGDVACHACNWLLNQHTDDISVSAIAAKCISHKNFPNFATW